MTINVWSDSMQHIELLGKPALFSDSRVDRSTVPDGWYVYDLRGSDYDPDLISTLEARVIVNYAGSILTPEPVIFPDGQDYLDVKGQTDFLDEEITLIDFCRQHEMPIPSRYQIRPASFDEAGLFYAMKPEEDQRLGCIGHVRMDFGHRGKEFWHTWWPRGPEELNSPEFKAELQQVVDELRTGVLKDLSSMSKYCWSHGGEVGNWPSNYGYIVETENYRYCLRCNPVPGDYQREISVDGGELYVHLWNSDDWSIQTEKELFAPRIAKGLPELCFSTLLTTGQLICIKRGETGYYPSDWDTGDKEKNVELADQLNEEMGVTMWQRKAMEVGSMCGWDVPGADPKAYEQEPMGMTLS